MNNQMQITAIAPCRDVDALEHALSLVRGGTLTISDDGTVWRHCIHDRRGGRKAVKSRRAENKTKKGYLAITFGVLGTRKTRSVLAHVLVWTHWNGTIPDGLQVNHKDLNKTNNSPGNLELTTGAENIRHSYANGRTRPWSKATEWRPGKPRITTEVKASILALRRQGLGAFRISKLTGVSKTHIERIFKEGGAQCK